MELEVPKRVIFRGTLSTVMVQQDAVREGKRGSFNAKVKGPWDRKDVIIVYLMANIIEV